MASTSQGVILRRIFIHRKFYNMSRREVAERMGVNVKFVEQIEYNPDAKRGWGTLCAYAEAVGVELVVDVRPPSL